MLGRLLGIFALLAAFAAPAKAQTVPPAPAPTPEPVAAEQHPIQVGDVIMAPAIEEPETETETETERQRFAPPEKAREPRRWYGAPILVADGVAYGGLALAINVERTNGIALPSSIGTFLLAGPIIHAVHGRWGRMGLSVGARALFPVGGVLLGATGCTAGSDCSGSLATGAIVGMLAATIVDAAVLAYEPVSEMPAVQPLVSLGRDQLLLGAGGTF